MSDLKFFFFDTSAICRMVLVKEPGADKVKELTEHLDNKIFTSWILIAESLGVLKRKLKNCELSEKEYQDAVIELFRRIKADLLKPIDLTVEHDFPKLVTYEHEIRKIRKKYSYLDAADAIQLAAIRNSFLRLPGSGSQTKLVSADRNLLEAAKTEGFSVLAVNK